MTKNIGKSVRDKLMNITKKQNSQFNIIVTRYYYERLLYRLSLSDYRDKFYLKGGTLLYVTQKNLARPTLDIDFLGVKIKNDLLHIKDVFTEVCSINPDTADGVEFDIDSITTETITEGKDYSGVRVSLNVKLDTMRQRMKIDIGFGDTIVPSEVELLYPTLIEDDQTISIIAYSLESVVAEKFHAMIELASINSRYKDFYDIYTILLYSDIDMQSLTQAILSTFQTRHSQYVDNHIIFTEQFVNDATRQTHWSKFLKNIDYKGDLPLSTVMKVINENLKPIYEKTKGYE